MTKRERKQKAVEHLKEAEKHLREAGHEIQQVVAEGETKWCKSDMNFETLAERHVAKPRRKLEADLDGMNVH